MVYSVLYICYLEMDDAEKTSLIKPTSLDLRHSNNVMIDKTMVIQPECLNDSDNTSAVSSMIVCSTLSDTTITSVDPVEPQATLTISEQDLVNGNDIRSTDDDMATMNENCKGDSAVDMEKMQQNKGTKETSRELNDLNKDEQTCALFGQMINTEDEAWDLLSDAASWESSFPVSIFNDLEDQPFGRQLSKEEDDLPSGWKKVEDAGGTYYWHIESGVTQTEHPGEVNMNEEKMTSTESTETMKATSSDSLKNVDTRSKKESHRWSGNSKDGHLFLVRSLGWLPIEHENLHQEVSSAAVNSCIRLLSNNRSQIMDGVGVWGEGKDLMLLLNDDQLKIVDPLENAVLQSQSIRHIRLWGVGRDSPHDFAYVVRDSNTHIYKCHVYRCDAPAKAIAKQLHTICSGLIEKRRLQSLGSKEKAFKLDDDNADQIPAPTVESCQTFLAKYMGSIRVSKPNGIEVLKQAMHNIMKELDGDGFEVQVSVSPSALIISKVSDDHVVVNCRMRCLSFMGVGDEIQLFGFISVMGADSTCYILHCSPNAAKIAIAVQEACMLRYQKAIDSNQHGAVSEIPSPRKSFKSKLSKLFSGWKNLHS